MAGGREEENGLEATKVEKRRGRGQRAWRKGGGHEIKDGHWQIYQTQDTCRVSGYFFL